MAMFSSRAIAPLALMLLAGCQTGPLPEAGSLDAGFGEALKYDMAIQTIDPDPVYDQNDAQPGASGALGAAAAKRYRLDQVKKVEAEGTTAGSAGPR
jgi:hypothetical protein